MSKKLHSYEISARSNAPRSFAHSRAKRSIKNRNAVGERFRGLERISRHVLCAIKADEKRSGPVYE